MKICPCCGHTKFQQTDILWKGLIKDWKLSKAEADYINKQQGYACESCGSNLRSMTLAAAVMKAYDFKGYFKDFVKAKKKLRVLEINEAGHLTPFLEKMRHHTLAKYPDVDMLKMPYEDDSFDLVVHSDTLEHVHPVVKALNEARRVSKQGGVQCFTTPIIIGRLSSSRDKKSPSYHGSPGNDEYLVRTEFGADIWKDVMEAGYSDCQFHSEDFPAGVAVIAKK